MKRLLLIVLLTTSLSTFAQHLTYEHTERKYGNTKKITKTYPEIERGTYKVLMTAKLVDEDLYAGFSDCLYDLGYYFEIENDRRLALETQPTQMGLKHDSQFYMKIRIKGNQILVEPYLIGEKASIITGTQNVNTPMRYDQLGVEPVFWTKIMEDVSGYSELVDIQYTGKEFRL